MTIHPSLAQKRVTESWNHLVQDFRECTGPARGERRAAGVGFSDPGVGFSIIRGLKASACSLTRGGEQ